MCGELLRERAFTRRRRPVNGDNHRRSGDARGGKRRDACGLESQNPSMKSPYERLRKHHDRVMRVTAAVNRLRSLKTLLAHARERLGVDIGVVLWDGSTIPEALAPNAFALAIADEGAVAALIRRPTLNTVLNLVVSARLELRNGTTFDLMAQRSRVRAKDFAKVLDKRLALATAARFVFV